MNYRLLKKDLDIWSFFKSDIGTEFSLLTAGGRLDYVCPILKRKHELFFEEKHKNIAYTDSFCYRCRRVLLHTFLSRKVWRISLFKH